jgi:GTP-binding protein
MIDTAGIRRKSRISLRLEKYSIVEALRTIDRCQVALLLLDSKEGVTDQDAHIGGFIHEKGKGCILVVNKWDLAPGLELNKAQCAREIQQKLKFFPDVPVVFASAQFGKGIGGVLAAAKQVYMERQMRIATPLLNEKLRKVLDAHSPPSVGGKKLRVSYVTQPGVNPPTFVFFVNDPRLLHFTYQRYLENSLRDAFGFKGTPLKIIFKRKGKND